MKMEDILESARNMLIEYGLRGWKVITDSNKTTFGVCYYSRRTLSFSKYLENHSDDQIIDTIKHEVAHARVSSKAGVAVGHNEEWRQTFISMGGSGMRCSEQSLTEHLWEGACDSGCQVFRRHRRIRNAFCPTCDAPLVWTNTKTKESSTFTNFPAISKYKDTTLYAPKGKVWADTMTPWLDTNTYSNNKEFKLAMSLGFEDDVQTNNLRS